MSYSTGVGVVALLVWIAACQPAAKTETATTAGDAAGDVAGASAAPAGLSAEDEAAVRAVDAEWARAFTAGDGKAVAALYATDATILPPMEPMKKGEAAKTYWIDFANNFSGKAELTTTAVEGRGDLAYATGTYRMSLTPKKAGAKPLPVEQGKYVEVVKKQGDGSWKIVYDIWSPDAPPAKQ
ncbi:MAG TPA: SgcJ/EcaC family oxidoreductase [Gemmatimonadales bacterium]|jgi:uncharacterized protein (TIGR02246 family)|nr:SgcJ/EcaC family oxidoreductase [Gemmatimonadales bacterium]